MAKNLQDDSSYLTLNLNGLSTAREAKAFLRIGNTTLYKLCREGKLTPIKFSRRCTRFRVAEIMKLIGDSHPKGGA